jgi:uncharacterized protein YdeI (BOF family)
MKPVLMIHEIHDRVFELPLEDYVLTFDDGLYSQYYYFDRFKHIPTEKIFFISTGIICDGPQSTEFPTSVIAHEKAFNGNKEDFMTVAQIKELIKDPWVSIGGHSHSHKRLDNIDKITGRIKHIFDDTQMMNNWFKANLGFVPTKFCYPYNNDHEGMYKGLLKTLGYIDFYGKERVSV